jgi:hypothetical protein
MMTTLELSDEHIAIIGKALSELPFRISAPVIHAIEQQLRPKPPEVRDNE